MPYPVAQNITYNEPEENNGLMRIMGKYGFSGTADLPSGQNGCTISNVGMITDRSIILIQPQVAGQPITELKYDIAGNLVRVTGDNGTFTVVTSNTVFIGATNETFSFLVVNP